MAEHTPGPWEWHYSGAVTADEGLVIASVDPDNALLLKYTLANAALIAAAPALLALVEAMEWVKLPHRGCPWCGMYEHAGHASDCPRQRTLARARGGGSASTSGAGTGGNNA